MASKIIIIEPSAVRKKIRVAAYCRVSSSSEDQLHSFAAQVQYYTKYINSNDKMELVDIYADEGLTGTKTEHRDEFNRMIADCRKGKIDRVLTKSLSRFARNTADALMYARLLRENGVSILFEKENIDTAYMSSELLLALSGAQAQEESISISKNMRWSVGRRMKNGTYLASSTPYGYKIVEREFVIVEEEAEIVRLIFKSYLSGMGKKEIADMLSQQNAPKRYAHSKWNVRTVDYILQNTRYIGDALFQKTYTTDTLPFQRKLNYGEKPQYYVDEINVAIISKHDFYAVQERLDSERCEYHKVKNIYPLQGKMVCSCGKMYKPVFINEKYYWECRNKNNDIDKCQSRRIPQKDIYEAFITMTNKLRNNCKSIVTAAISQTERLNMKYGNTAGKIKEIDKNIAELSNKQLVLARLNSKGMFRAAEYSEKSGKLTAQIKELRAERKRLLQEQDENSILSGLNTLENVLVNLKEPLTEFDEDIFKAVVQKITFPSDTEICFELAGGLKITEKIPEQARCRRT